MEGELIYLCPALLFFLKSITVCKHVYISISPPIINYAPDFISHGNITVRSQRLCGQCRDTQLRTCLRKKR